jgi:hypothetical protein
MTNFVFRLPARTYRSVRAGRLKNVKYNEINDYQAINNEIQTRFIIDIISNHIILL